MTLDVSGGSPTSTPTMRRYMRPGRCWPGGAARRLAPERVRAASGEIVPPVPSERSLVLVTEDHAFLIVGYTSQGFLVLDSWGRDGGRDRRVNGELEHPAGRSAQSTRELGE